ncbi:Heparanase-like protein 2 [Hordeum vulgare]|nr:Heparanase-like protein 2 [Hordeum vulgare]
MLHWVWRITRGDGGLWLRLLEAKYLQGIPLLACSRSVGSLFWKSIQAIKEEIRVGLRFSVHNGSGTQFWLDPWLDGAPLRLRFPGLFVICAAPTILVSEAALADGWHLEFCRSFGLAEVLEWNSLQEVVPLPLSRSRTRCPGVSLPRENSPLARHIWPSADVSSFRGSPRYGRHRCP